MSEHTKRLGHAWDWVRSLGYDNTQVATTDDPTLCMAPFDLWVEHGGQRHVTRPVPKEERCIVDVAKEAILIALKTGEIDPTHAVDLIFDDEDSMEGL